jgi:uncharacterized small protein (DUF1192 family)
MPREWSVEERLAVLENKIEELEDAAADPDGDDRPGKRDWSTFKIFIPIISSLIVAGTGLLATFTIKASIDREKLELSNVAEMRDLLTTLREPGIERRKAEATAVSLAAFGTYAVVPLVMELQADGVVRPGAAEEGLRAVLAKEPEKACKALLKVLDNRTGLYSWKTHRDVVRLLGEGGCADAIPVLREMKSLLASEGGIETYRTTVRDGPTAKIDKIERELDRALERLER